MSSRGKETEERSLVALALTLFQACLRALCPIFSKWHGAIKLSTLFLACATIFGSVSSDLLRDTLVLKSPQRLATEDIFLIKTKYILPLKCCCFPPETVSGKTPAAVSILLHFQH